MLALRLLVAALAAFIITACAPGPSGDPRLAGPSAQDLNRLASAPSIRGIIARSAAETLSSAQAAARLAATGPGDAQGLRYLEISAIPYLRQSPEGAAFLLQSAPRALVRGAPAENCPAAAASPSIAATMEEAATSALSACFAQLAKRGAPAACGCEFMAIDGLLTTPRRQFTFATGVSAFLIRGNEAKSTPFVAEATPNDLPGESVLLRTPAGVGGVLLLSGDTAELQLADDADTLWRGERQPFGYRRGRLAERISLSSDDGRQIKLLIGVERRDTLARKLTRSGAPLATVKPRP